MVGGYCRLSDEDRFKLKDTDESESIQNQRDLLIEYINNKEDWKLYDIYVDDDVSGASINRPAFERLINDCREGKIDIVICKSQSRFTRTLEEVETIIHNKFMEWQVRFIGIVDHADTDNKGNKKQRQINGLTNEWYLEDGSENIKSALKTERKSGKFTGSFAPYGYLINPKNKNHLIIDPIASVTVYDIFKKYSEGLGYKKICDYLNSQKIPSPYEYKKQLGSKFVCNNVKNDKTYWNNDTIAKILKEEMYLGKLLQGKTTYVSYKNKKIIKLPRKDWIIVENTHEAIIDNDLWNKVSKRFKDHHKVTKIGKVHLFSKKVYCQECKKSYTKYSCNTISGSKEYLRCSSRRYGMINCNNSSVRYDALEKIILNSFKEKINEYLNEEKLIANIKSRLKECSYIKRIKGLSLENKNLLRLIERKKIYLKKLYENKIDNVINNKEFLLLKNEYYSDIKSMKIRLDYNNKEISSLNYKSKNIIDIEKLLKTYKNINQLTIEIVESFISKIVIYKINKVLNERCIQIEWNLF